MFSGKWITCCTAVRAGGTCAFFSLKKERSASKHTTDTHRHTDLQRQTCRHKHTDRDRQTYEYRHRQMDSFIHTDRQTEIKKDLYHTPQHTHTHTHTHLMSFTFTGNFTFYSF